MKVDPNDSIQSLARIAAASARLMAVMHHRDKVCDPAQEIAHMRANLDHVEAELRRGTVET